MIIDAQYTVKYEHGYKGDVSDFIFYITIALIYGIPLILGWGVSVMSGVKWNPYLAIMAAPIYGSLLVAGVIWIYIQIAEARK